MASNIQRKKGIVILLDALGASEYSDEKINEFLNARKEINSIIHDLLNPAMIGSSASIYMFGDTIVVTVELVDEYVAGQILFICTAMQWYLFRSLQKGILYRGAFSIGSYIEDATSNTVMGEAITDAAQWYEKADWMGLVSTPKTDSVLEYYVPSGEISDSKLLCRYPVPIKGSSPINLYSISWPELFYSQRRDQTSPRKLFLEIFKEFSFPASATEKYLNTKKYFDHIERQHS